MPFLSDIQYSKMSAAFPAFLLVFLLSNLLLSTGISLWLSKKNTEIAYSNTELWLYCLGLGPALTSLIIYFSFLLLPGQASFFYIVMVCACIAALFFSSRKQIRPIGSMYAKSMLQTIQKADRYTVAFFSFLLVFIAYVTYKTISVPITGHDTLEYALFAKALFGDKAIHYAAFHHFPDTGFYFVGLHGFSFPLLATWERLVNSLFLIDTDFYFRSITAYYSILLLGVCFYWLRKLSSMYAITGILLMICCFGYFSLLTSYHLDTYRILLLVVSWIFFVHAVRFGDMLSISLFGIFSGAQSFIHSLGFILALAALGILFFLLKDTLLQRFKKTIWAGILILLFGGIHYLIDIFWGTGWIFNTIKYY